MIRLYEGLYTDKVRIFTHKYLALHTIALFSSPNIVDIFKNLGANGKDLADKIRTVLDSADVMRIVRE